jgi:hypothetical protein
MSSRGHSQARRFRRGVTASDSPRDAHGQRERAKDDAKFVFENRAGAGSIAHRGKKAASVLSRSLSFTFRAHDLWCTAATRMAEAGVTHAQIARVLNHVQTGPAATRVYDRDTYDLVLSGISKRRYKEKGRVSLSATRP